MEKGRQGWGGGFGVFTVLSGGGLEVERPAGGGASGLPVACGARHYDG
jgi:hypothetical protein